jgi:uncharacterized membrane protein
MINAATATAILAATTHHRHGFLAIIVLVVIVGLVYYGWRQRQLRLRHGRDNH